MYFENVQSYKNKAYQQYKIEIKVGFCLILQRDINVQLSFVCLLNVNVIDLAKSMM